MKYKNILLFPAIGEKQVSGLTDNGKINHEKGMIRATARHPLFPASYFKFRACRMTGAVL